MTQQLNPWSLTPFERWVEEEGLPVVCQQHISDIREVKLGDWRRTGCSAALLDVDWDPFPGARVNRQGVIAYLCDIPPGGTFNAEKHLYEEIFYVVSGRGATTVWNEGMRKHTFEWGEGSVFSIPLNSWHQIDNGQGDRPTKLYAVTNAPVIMNLYQSREFVFNSPHVFTERFRGDEDRYFSGETAKLESRFTETNFIADARNTALDTWSERGPGANMMTIMAGGHFICHISEFPPGTYKKAHSHHVQQARGSIVAGGALILMVKGGGYDLQWPPDTRPSQGTYERVDWKDGTLLSAGRGYHQHFNTSGEGARYVVLRPGNPRFSGALGAHYKQTGGEQIEPEDEDPMIRKMFVEELEREGRAFAMDDVRR